MIALTLYDGTRHPQVGDCVRSILQSDQHDDWINDPVYYQDFKEADARIAKAIQNALNAGSFDGESGATIDLPRGGKATIKGAYLPLPARVLNYVFVAGAIKAANTTAFRAKVYGFRYLEGAVPLFSTPQAELNELQGSLTELVKEAGKVHIIDARGYLNSISPASLQQALEQAGVARAEVRVVLGLSGLGDASRLASGDDSHAALYDLFLHPIDKALVDRRLNFFRYRDDYFSPHEEAANVIAVVGRQIGIEFARKGQVSRDDLTFERADMFTLDDGTRVQGNFECLDKDKLKCTDKSEIEFLFRRPSLKRFLEREFRPNEEIDAVTFVPFLRALNELRAPDVLRLASDPLVSTSLRKLKTEIAGARPVLGGLVGGWRRSPASVWAACWAMQALSDLGPLTQPEVAAITELAAANSVHGFGRCLAMMALARSAAVEAAVPVFRSFASAPRNGLGSRYFSARALVLAHHYLTMRNARDTALPDGVAADADGLAAFLASARSK